MASFLLSLSFLHVVWVHLAKKRASKHNYCIEHGAGESRRGKGVHMVACGSGILANGMKKYSFGQNTLHHRSAFISFLGGVSSTRTPNMPLIDLLRPIQLITSP